MDVDILELARMAKLELTESESGDMRKHLEFLLRDFEKLSKAGQGSAEPMIYGTELQNVFREDKAAKEIGRETLLQNAPEHENGYFIVPMTLE
ncbi:MAG: Asp-tRNA(Asn)/Glu-tRNA(Gln) amidotransferase subunit GatC [Clostridiales bacterium]|nr:Asp-tRNA(Asn)/Glu-tRNA(Gln) amidotransferase subunit GatC [Clostridiales bacterium]